MAQGSGKGSSKVDTDADRHPTLARALSKALKAANEPDLQVEWVELSCQANGDISFRYREPRADEVTVGFAPGQSPE